MRKLSRAIWEGMKGTKVYTLRLISGDLLEPFHIMISSRMVKASVRKIYSMFLRRIQCKFLPPCHTIMVDYPERYDPQVGYCQGLPFVVAILLLNVRHSCRPQSRGLTFLLDAR
jgi:hypothetical protein